MSVEPRNIREEIERYVPGITANNSQHGIEKLQILLVGWAGHGKSSLINSTICVTKNDRYQNLTGARKAEEGNTTKRTSYPLTNKIYITDNRGFSSMKAEEVLEVSAQLRHLRLEGDVDWDKSNLDETIKMIPHYKPPKELILPVIVHSCLQKFSANEETLLLTLIKKSQEIIGIPPIVVITNIGLSNNKYEHAAAIEKRFGDMGCSQRICLESYTENNQTRSAEADDQFLQFLVLCMEEAEYVIQQTECTDPYQKVAQQLADQLKEELKVERKRMQREVEMERNRVMEEGRAWWKTCAVM
ncbi:uncharacterized protein [Pyxicephalus adspersus]|uniref:uncharacterized protein n=1 Tax=Pyxicephalus adspersus TaxID=30357 RepID=UPI003B5A34C9